MKLLTFGDKGNPLVISYADENPVNCQEEPRGSHTLTIWRHRCVWRHIPGKFCILKIQISYAIFLISGRDLGM